MTVLLTPENVIQQERLRAEQAQQRAQQERLRAEQAQQQLDQERRLREELLSRLRERGINLNDL